MSKQVYAHLLAMDRTMAHSLVAQQMLLLPQFSAVKSTTMGKYLNRFRHKYPIPPPGDTDRRDKGETSRGQTPLTAKKGPPEDSLPDEIDLALIKKYIIRGLMGHDVNTSLVNIALNLVKYENELNPIDTTSEVIQKSLKRLSVEQLTEKMMALPH